MGLCLYMSPDIPMKLSLESFKLKCKKTFLDEHQCDNQKRNYQYSLQNIMCIEMINYNTRYNLQIIYLKYSQSGHGETLVCHLPAALRTQVRICGAQHNYTNRQFSRLCSFFGFYGSVGLQTMRRLYHRWQKGQLSNLVHMQGKVLGWGQR